MSHCAFTQVGFLSPCGHYFIEDILLYSSSFYGLQLQPCRSCSSCTSTVQSTIYRRVTTRAIFIHNLTLRTWVDNKRMKSLPSPHCSMRLRVRRNGRQHEVTVHAASLLRARRELLQCRTMRQFLVRQPKLIGSVQSPFKFFKNNLGLPHP